MIAQVWAEFLHRGRVYGDVDATPKLGAFLRGQEALDVSCQLVVEPHHSAHIEELVEGAGGTLSDLASLVIAHIALIPALPSETIQILGDVLIFTRDAQFRRLVWPASTFASAGLLQALIDAICTVIETGGENMTTVVEIAFTLIEWVTSSDLNYLRTALKAGFLRAIVLCAAANLGVPRVHDLLARELPACSIHYYVLRQMRSSLRAVQNLAASPEFTVAPLFIHWQEFVDLVDERGKIADSLDSGDRPSFRACDNLKVECLSRYPLP